jgi:Dynein heavy chain, N-terminal region 2
LKRQLWQGHYGFSQLCAEWASTIYSDIDLVEMEERIQAMHRTCHKLERELPPNNKVPVLRSIVDEHMAMLPVLRALSNAALKDQHWSRIAEITGVLLSGPESSAITLQQLFKLQINVHQADIVQISFEASQEAALEQMLAQLNAKWSELEFTVLFLLLLL